MGDMGPEEPQQGSGEPGSKLPEGQKISAVCASCGKGTTLNFVPTEGRPIYCKDCLTKIKAGEMPRVKVAKFKAPKIQDRSFSDLAGLGIEFEEQKGAPKPSEVKTLTRDPIPPSRPRETREAVVGSSTATLSLKDLKPSSFDRVPKEKKPSTVSIDEIRKSIAEALKEQIANEGSNGQNES